MPPSARPDPAYLVFALVSAALVTLVSAAPPGLLEAAAGLALIGTLAASVSTALAVDSQGPRNA
ncbi:hypothetical protein [Arthrobacter sp. BE255]|uniref:hypothetical protein n=1 Tax=Arthrobacter sp. BE255 TaxID=2817721 RepID=UPI002863EC33|nr:hypothetical protein [Arthrobacter sp. BE255]MDR7159232.1 putative benzoate:H+ symporter BenE [Arthrobacter sp. BE255]